MDLGARLEAAALSLAGEGTIKDRLLDAYCHHLSDLQETDLPADMQAEFAGMIRALHSAPALRGDDVVRASVRKLSNEQAARYGVLVVRLFGMLAGMRHVAVTRTSRALPPLVKLLSEGALVNS
jgi:hypothetical protein